MGAAITAPQDPARPTGRGGAPGFRAAIDPPGSFHRPEAEPALQRGFEQTAYDSEQTDRNPQLISQVTRLPEEFTAQCAGTVGPVHDSGAPSTAPPRTARSRPVSACSGPDNLP